MDLNAVSRSPREEGELEDGEICDDETDESVPIRRGDGKRPGRGGGALRTRKPHPHTHNMLPHLGHQTSDFRMLMPYNHPPHGPFPPSHRQQCGPSGPDRPPAPSPPLLPAPPGLGPHGEPSPRSNFWERSHGALGRFRHRAMPNGGRGAWNRGSRAQIGRYGPGDSPGPIKESPSRKQKAPSRTQTRKVVHSVFKPDSSVDESFEDLLSKYKQIQLELECIRKEETMALEPKASIVRDDQTTSVVDIMPVPEPTPSPADPEDTIEVEMSDKKVFQAFNIRPLRQKLPTPANLDELQSGHAEQETAGSSPGEDVEDEKEAEAGTEPKMKLETKAEEKTCLCSTVEMVKEEGVKKTCLCRESSASSEDSVLSPDKPKVKVEEEELSELQLRLLALQSASKKWQLKEQQVMKKSKDRITKSIQERSSSSGPGNGAPTLSRQRITTRSASSAAPADRNRSRSKTLDKDKAKTGSRPPNRDRLLERDRPKLSPKPGPRASQERGRTSGKPHAVKKMISPGSVAKQAFRKQQLRTWKLQQQHQQEEKWRLDEEERRKREDEIRRIRDLSNQDEQYNRFMKLVGGKTRAHSQSTEREHRKSTGKQGLDASGNLYQYDNYDEVAMDTDSETSSPAPSPTQSPFPADSPGCFPQVSLYGTNSARLATDLSQAFLSPVLSGVPPPPPPLPPPPDELEPPPKPPFADEEEEEEMLLRETCLMSMANKRVAEVKCSNPLSPNGPSALPAAAAGIQQVVRGNLSTVSLNTVSQSRNRFSRTPHAARAPLVLPRHKSVVVSLKDSDDSDSDVDASSSTPSVFGGLEFMIKEARRTVEASKPKSALGCEKENNPVRTPQALPEAKKAEYRLLKEEIASREKQKMLKDHSMRSSTPPTVSESAAELKLCEAEQSVNKHRELLQRDEAILRHLLQQELKKRESLKGAEAKVIRLREQLQASEKIVSANKTLLKKLQEQVQRVENRVSMKKIVTVRLEKELAQAQLEAGRGHKRRTDSNQSQPPKLQRVDRPPCGSERHFAELIAQKQRLQRLESEYALKIQKLKEAQALRNKGLPSELPLRASTPSDSRKQIPPPSSPFPVPQPSLHDLTQDKLTLDSEDVTEPDYVDSEPAAAAKGPRRRSLRQSSGSFTKPNLEQLSSIPAKDSSTKPGQTSGSFEAPAEMFAGLDVDALKLRDRQQPGLGNLLQREVQNLGGQYHNLTFAPVVFVAQDSTMTLSGSRELKPVAFGPYHSPLLVFRSYRFSPYYRTKEKLSLSSITYSNSIDPKKCFCRFDLTGTCNDDGCKWQHIRDFTLTGNQLFQDILSYNLSLISCSECNSDEDISLATEKYMKKLFGTNKDRMGTDQKAVLLVSKVNESKQHVPPFTTCKDLRTWKPKPSVQSSASPEDASEDDTKSDYIIAGGQNDSSKSSLSVLDVCVTSDDKRYFVSETDDISNLETSVMESPADTQLWIKLAFKYLNQNEVSTAECLEAALNTLSRALETNCDDPEVWSHYLSLFSRRGSREEVQEMCEMAVEHAPHYDVWWHYLNMESSFEGKDYVCDRLLQFLLTQASTAITEKLSFQLMEALLYRVHLHLFTGRMESSLAILQNALKSAQDRSIAEHLTAKDRALVWLSYIHLTEFDQLPPPLYDPSDSGPSRLVSREPFMLPWKTSQDISTPLNILIALFQDAIQRCSDSSSSQSEQVVACMPLHTNLIFLHQLLQRFDQGISLCKTLLEVCPESCTVRDALAELHIRKGDPDQAVSMWLHALAECPDNAEIFYHSCRFLMAQEKSSAIVPLFRAFVLSLCEDEQSHRKPVEVLRHILGFSTDEFLRGPVVKKELEERLSQQLPYFHLIHCRWQWLHGSVEDTVEAFERALGSNVQLDELHQLWMEYLQFTSSHQARGAGSSRLLSDLVHRCLSTIPSRLEFPYNPAEFWSCYRFHNKVVALYLSCLPQSQHAQVLERLRQAMPNSTELGLRLLHQEWQDGNTQHLKFQARMLSSITPKCLAYWKIAIAVERELKQRSEVRLLYQQALQNLPLCAALWKDRLLFEAAAAGDSERLRRLVDQCQQVGVSLVLS